MSEALRRERAALRLVCCCEDCEHFVGAEVPLDRHGSPPAPPHASAPAAAAADPDGRCDLLYPTTPHRRATWDAAQDGDEISFCKMFEAK